MLTISQKRFIHNNRCILGITIFLFVEQLAYAFFVYPADSWLGKVHVYTGLLSGIYALVSYQLFKREATINPFWGDIFVSLAILIGFSVSVIRTLPLESNGTLNVPIIYIAIIYGFAFVFYYPPKWSITIYGFATLLLIIMMVVYDATLFKTTLLPDILSNKVIALIASFISYRRYEKDYYQTQIISQKNKELTKLSEIDMLTQVSNRRHINQCINAAHQLALAEGIPYAILIIDIDHFKHVNDTYGHQKGDLILVEFAHRLQNHIRKQDAVGRWGGEEFIVLCHQTNTEEALIVANKLNKQIHSEPFAAHLNISCSIGISVWSDATESTHDMLYQADQSLYQAKNQGRNRVIIYEGS